MVLSWKYISGNISHVRIGSSNIEVPTSAKNLGVVFDTPLNMNDHANGICESAFVEIRNIGRIRKHLDDKATSALVHVFVSSTLD